MRTTVFVLIVAVLSASAASAQSAPAPRPAPATQQPRPARAPAAAPTMTVQVTDASGLPLANVQVTAQGPVSRDATTGEDGSARFANMRTGAYRLRFAREGFNLLERDVTIRPGEPLLVDASLNPAPAVSKPPEPARTSTPSTSEKPLGPPAEPKVTAIPTFLEKNFIGRDGRKDSPLGCTTTGTSTLIQLREALLNQVHQDADEWVYVVAGEGTLRIGTSDQRLQAGTFSLVPRTISHGLLPTGRNPLIVVSILTGYRTC
jgi:mannose-6-phosphate isomerase-like protein (cupin superfamily)